MAEKKYALDLDATEWGAFVEKELGEPSFRAAQICRWLWRKHTDDAQGMTNLSKELRNALDERFIFAYPRLAKEERSKTGTRKFLWRMADGEGVESVLMKYKNRVSACVSTQAGCPLGCAFCATGSSGFSRNLSAGEIAGQFLAMEKLLGKEIDSVVYMGMGEPFLNVENVLKSVRMLNDAKLRALGARRVTISTAGVVPGIEELAASGLPVRLAVSLHAANDGLRSELMPINGTYPLASLRDAMQKYQEKTGDRITIEYALFGGVNDAAEDARELARFLKGIHAFVNLIPCNATDGAYEKPNAEDVLRFRSVLQSAGFETEIRAELGADIDAACGQLRLKSERALFDTARLRAKKEKTKEPARGEKENGTARTKNKTKRRETENKTAAAKGAPAKGRFEHTRDEKPKRKSAAARREREQNAAAEKRADYPKKKTRESAGDGGAWGERRGAPGAKTGASAFKNSAKSGARQNKRKNKETGAFFFAKNESRQDGKNKNGKAKGERKTDKKTPRKSREKSARAKKKNKNANVFFGDKDVSFGRAQARKRPADAKKSESRKSGVKGAARRSRARED